jgi:hypothetical protein
MYKVEKTTGGYLLGMNVMDADLQQAYVFSFSLALCMRLNNWR